MKLVTFNHTSSVIKKPKLHTPKTMDLLTCLENLGIHPKKSSTAHGGEYSSACPRCGDGGKGANSDRFCVWPNRSEKGAKAPGRYWCRRCDASGDAISFAMEFMGQSFPEACATFGVVLPNVKRSYSRGYQAPPTQSYTEDWQPTDYPLPSALWQEKAGNLLADSIDRLAHTPDAIDYLERRGLSRTAIDRYKLGYNQSTKGGDRYRPREVWGLPAKANGKNKLWIPRGWVIPNYRHGQLIQLRVRRLKSDIEKFAPEIKYLPIDGSSSATMVLYPKADLFAVVECGFDAMLIAELFHGKLGVVTTWNCSARPDAYAHNILKRSALIINLLDYDQGGEEQQDWWKGRYPNQYLRPPAPSAGADPGDMYGAGVDIRSWILSHVPAGVRLRLEGAPQKPATPKNETPSKSDKTAPPRPLNGVVDITLSNGYVIKLTDDASEYQKLLAAGEPVFDSSEIAKLQHATATMTPEERIQAAMSAVEVKMMFGGTVGAGRQL